MATIVGAYCGQAACPTRVSISLRSETPVTAALMIPASGGKSAVKQLLSRVVLWRVGARWYVIALGLPTVLALAAAGLYYLFDASRPLPDRCGVGPRLHRLRPRGR